MKKTIFVFVFLCFFIFNSFAQNMKFTYEGTRIDNFGMKSYDPERGSIEVDFYSKNRHKAQRKAKFYINKCRSASCMQGGLKQASA